MNEMFCFQCQQTAHNTGCEGKVGVCGKKSDTSNYQDEIVGALIALANEQKAVCILLTLLYLGIKNMYLGPTIPAFVSNGVLNTLNYFFMKTYYVMNCMLVSNR